MKKLNIGLIGAGRIGQLHAQNLAQFVPGARLKAIADMQIEAAHRCGDALGVAAVSSHGAILNDPSIDAVAICTSTDTHAQLIIEAAEAGKHIFCEKPIDFDLAHIDQALAAVAAANVQLQIGFNRRFDANAQRIKRGIENGEVGRVHRLHIISRDPSPPSAAYIARSGGMFVDMTIHDFDMARFLMGCEATEVFTMAGALVDPMFAELGDVDTAVILMKFENGAFVSIDNSRQAVYGYDQRMEVFGSAGSLESANVSPNRVAHKGADAISMEKPLHFFLERYKESFVVEMNAFVNAVLNDKAVPVNGNDGRMPAVMGMAAKASYEQNRPMLIQ